MHSTLTALIDITDNWYLNIDDGLTNAILFIDLKKAFHTIDHEILLSKLELYGFKGASLNLLRDYLSDRTQVTVINNVNSETSFISCGVPQGSILGPLLFLLYINDLPNCNLLSDVRMYADDTNLTFASKDPNELFSSLTHDLGNLKQWLDSNRLSLNVLKTKCLFTGTSQKISLLPSEPHICLDGHSIERVNSYKCLGVQVDETLSWEAHISEVIGSCLEKAKTDMSPEYSSHNLQVIGSSASRLLQCCLGLYRKWPQPKTTETAKQGCTHNNRVQLGCQICPDSSCP